MINLYFDAKDKVYYFNDLNKACDSCGQIIEGHIIIRVFWDKLQSGANYFCNNCKDKLTTSDRASFTDTYMAMVDADVPSKAMPVVFSKPSLSPVRNIMTCDAADMNLDNEQVIDKTVYANRKEAKVKEYFIEAEEDDIALKLGHKPMDDTELDGFFASVKNSVPMIESTEQKVLK